MVIVIHGESVMKFNSFIRRITLVSVGLFISLPAFATWDGQVRVTGSTVEDLQNSTITFETNGELVPVEVQEDRDGSAILLIGYSGDSATPGTLSIRGPGVDNSILMPAAGPGQNIYVDTTGRGNATTLRPANTPVSSRSVFFPRSYVALDLGYQNLQGGDIATASTTIPGVTPGDEVPTLNASYDNDAVGGGITFAYNTGGSLPGFIDRTGFSSNLMVGFSFSSYSDDEDNNAVSTDLIDRGYLYTTILPSPNDFTGPFLGPTQAQSFANIDVTISRFETFMEWLCDRPMSGDSFIKSRVDFGYTKWDVDVESRDTFDPPFPGSGILQTLNQRQQSVDQEIFDVGLGSQIINPLGNGWDIYGGATVRVYYSDADLSSLERNFINGAEDVRRVVRNDDEWDIGLDLNFGAGYTIAENWRISADAAFLLNVPSASIDNPISGDGSNAGSNELFRTAINYDNETLWSLGLNVRYAFD